MSVHIISHTCKKRKLLRQQRKRHSKLSPGSECQCWPPSLAPNSSVTTGCTCCSLHPFPLMSHCWCDEYAGLRTHEQIKRRMLSQLIKSASRISSIVYIYIYFKKKLIFHRGHTCDVRLTPRIGPPAPASTTARCALGSADDRGALITSSPHLKTESSREGIA